MLTATKEKVRALYDQGMSDRDIGQEVGTDRWNILYWRRVNGLPANIKFRSGKRPTAMSKDRAALVARGLPDAEIARRQGVTESAIAHWRNKRGLSFNRVTFKPNQPHPMVAVIRQAIGWHHAPDIAEEAICEMLLAMVEGKLTEGQIEAEAGDYVAKVYRQFASNYGTRSIDEDLTGGGFRLIDRLRDDSHSEWLEEMGATVW